MKGNINFLKIPVNRIIALVLMDIMSIVVASFVAIYIRFDFKFNGIPGEYLIKFEHILPYNLQYGSYIRVSGDMQALLS